MIKMNDTDLEITLKRINEMRDDNPDSLKNITLGEVDEVMLCVKIADEDYCKFTCARCPLYQENGICNPYIKTALEYDIYYRLFGKFTCEEYIFIRKVIDLCLSDDMGISDIKDFLLEKYDIDMDDDIATHVFRKDCSPSEEE